MAKSKAEAGGLLFLYRAATALVAPLVLRARTAKGKEDPARLRERRGLASLPRPEGRVIWIHGASVGECLAALPLITVLVERGDTHVLVTSGTVSSARLMMERLPRGAIHQFVPLDAPSAVRRFLNHWKPQLGIFIESELWPNLLEAARLRKIPLLLVNARLSDRSYRGWKRAPKLARRLLFSFAVCLAQDAKVAERLTELGAEHVRISGSLKADAPLLPVDDAAFDAFSAAITGRPLFLAASTHPGEEKQILQAARLIMERLPDLLTIIVPRHPRRGKDITTLAERHGLNALLRSTHEGNPADTQIYIADTMGELGLFYRIAPFAFVGGSLVPHGGQNPLEPARMGKAVLVGPYTANFQDITQILLAAQEGGRVQDAASLSEAALFLLENPENAAQIGETVCDAAQRLGGALTRTLETIDDIMFQHARA